jgi:O-antigen/teichoic acid export membrane protein
VAGTTYSLVSLVTIRLLGVATSVVVARLLGKANLGMLAIVNNITGLAALFVTLGVPVALTRYVALARGNSETVPGFRSGDSGTVPLRSVVGTALVTMLVPLFILCLGLVLSADLIAVRIYHRAELATLIRLGAGVLLLGALGTAGFGQALLQGLQEIKRISLINIVVSVASLPVLVAATWLGRLPGQLAGQVIMAGLGLTLVLVALNRAHPGFGTLRFDRAFWPELMNMSVPAFLSGLVMTPALLLTTSRLFLAKGPAEVGLFNISYGLFQLVLFIPNAVAMPLIPMIAENWPANPERLRQFLRSALELVAFISLLLAVGVGIFARPLIGLLYGATFLDATPAMILMSGAVFFTTIGTVIGCYFAGTGKMWTGMAFNLLWFVVVLGAAFGFINPGGAGGLAGAFWLSYGLMTLAMIVYARIGIGVPVRYLTATGVLSLAVTALSLLLLRRLPALPFVAVGVTLYAAVALLAYWLLPAKAELRDSLAVVRQRLARR